MPTTRQATPGSSNALPMKRSASTDTEDSVGVPPNKKAKRDKSATNSPLAPMNGNSQTESKDKERRKKKRNKKKRKVSIVVPDPAPARQSRSRSARPMGSPTGTIAESSFIPPANIAGRTDEPNDPLELPPGSPDIVVDSDSEPEGDTAAPSHSRDKGKAKEVPCSASLTVAPLYAQPSLEVAEAALTSLIIASTSTQPSTSTQAQSQAAEIAVLTQQLNEQNILLQRHQNQLNSLQQSLTCQICLDLLRRPYALSPCGHITCYACLLRWFTAEPGRPVDGPVINPEDIVAGNVNNLPALPPGRAHLGGAFARRAALRRFMNKQKNCPICRANISTRPVEVYAVKDMVASLVRSGLTDYPAPAASTATTEGRNRDPWNNIFPPVGRRGLLDGFFGRQLNDPAPVANNNEPRGNLEDMGLHDLEDGGIYRCLDCMHEIAGRHCSNPQCRREYPGHNEAEDDSDEDDGFAYLHHILGAPAPVFMEDDDDDDDDDEDLYDQEAAMFADQEPDSDEDHHGMPWGWQEPNHDPALDQDDLDEEADVIELDLNIDEDEDLPPNVLHAVRNFGRRRRLGPMPIEVDDLEDERSQAQLGHRLGHRGPGTRGQPIGLSEEEDEEESDDDSFIVDDDDDDLHGEPGGDDDSEDSDSEAPVVRARTRFLQPPSDEEEQHEDDDEEQEQEEDRPALYRLRVSRGTRVASSSEDDEEDSEVEIVEQRVRSVRPRQRR